MREKTNIKLYRTILIVFFSVQITSALVMLIFFKMKYTGIGFASASILLPLAYVVSLKNKFTLSVNIITQIFPVIFIFLSVFGKLNNEGTSLVFYIAPRFGILVIILLPFLILGTRDKRKLILSVIFPFIWFVTFDYFHSIFNLNENILFHKTDYLLVALGSAIFLIIAVSIIYFLQNTNEEYENTIIAQQADLEKSLTKISESINYAKRIQEALLQGQNILNNYTEDNFIIFQPKEKVSGDFYWIKERNSKLYCMAADCTGHGVPGAFVSMLGIAFLNEIFTNTDYTASEILENLRRKFKEIFKQENNEIKDGMDAALFIIDKDKNILNYSGANNPLIQLRENIITEHKAAPNCIGINPKEKLFENTFIEIKKDDKYFVFSDGFIDQAGGETGRKITKRKFYELLIEYNSTNIKFTQNKLKEYLDLWMHDTKQTDDILIIGIKI